MELHLIRLQEPIQERAVAERRRCIRHKLQTPAYATFNRQTAGMVLDLSEVKDISEDGFAVQTTAQLAVNDTVSLGLDLPETRAYIQGTGRVVWSDGAGRAGIRFLGLP